MNVSINNYYAVKNSSSQTEFSNVRAQISENILNTILNISSHYIQGYYDFIKAKDINKALTLFQVITPMKAGPLGVENINMQLQTLFNHTKGKGYKTKLYEYKMTDKVIHIKK